MVTPNDLSPNQRSQDQRPHDQSVINRVFDLLDASDASQTSRSPIMTGTAQAVQVVVGVFMIVVFTGVMGFMAVQLFMALIEAVMRVAQSTP